MDSMYYRGVTSLTIENTVVFVTNIFLLHKCITKVNKAKLLTGHTNELEVGHSLSVAPGITII